MASTPSALLSPLPLLPASYDIKCVICSNKRPVKRFITCLCTKKLCFCCLAQLESLPNKELITPSNTPAEILLLEHNLPCPFCCKDLSAMDELAKAVMNKDDSTRKKKNSQLMENYQLKRKLVEIENDNVNLREHFEIEKKQKEEYYGLHEKAKIQKKMLSKIIIDCYEVETDEKLNT